MRVIICLLLTVLLLTPVWAQSFREDFETGMGGATSYHKAPNDVKIERLQGGAASGEWYLRGVLAGQKRLEGFAVTATGLTGARLAQVTARVRGRGELWLCLNSANGWLYAPQTTPLTDQWQTISLAKVLVANDKGVAINFLSRDVQQDAMFEVDDVRVELAPPLETTEVEVQPWRLEAEDFSAHARNVAADPQALGGKAVQSEQYVLLMDLPTPRTGKPLQIAVRVRSGEEKDSWRLATRQGGNLQYVRTVQATQKNEWEWLVFKNVLAGELGEAFALCSQRAAGGRGWVALDSVVVSTREGLTPEQLAAAAELLAQRPLAAVGRGATGVAIGDFVAVGTRTPAQTPTEVLVTDTEQGLKIRFDCHEPLLDTAQQRRHEFLAKVTQRDGDVYADDCVIVLLRPAGSSQVYDFTVNARGAIMDARCNGADLWASREVKWNSQATAQGTIEERRWGVELLIPWSDLGGRPQIGDRWGASFGRLAKGRKEQSAWNLANKGIHDPVALGTLVFAESVPAVRLQAPASLKLKGNPLPPASADPQVKAVVFAEITSPAGTSRAYGGEFDLPRDSDLQLAYGILDAASLQPLYLTTVLPQGVKASFAMLALACEGPYELFLNGRSVASGTAAKGEEKIEVALEKGSNVLALQLAQGTVALRGQVGEWGFDAADWAMSPAGTPQVLDPGADDGTWPRAPKVGQHPQLGPIVGEKDKPVVLRRTLLYEKTRIWPTPEPFYYLAQGVAQHLVFRTEGLKGRKLTDWETHLATPEGFEVLGSTGFYGNLAHIPRWKTTALGEQTVGGQKMRVYKISADQPVLTGRHHIMSEFQVLVRATANPPAEARFMHWSQANGGQVIEAPQTVKVKVLPPVKGAQCKTLVWQLWGGWIGNMNNLEGREHILDCARTAGFNDLVGGDRWTSDNASRYGLKHTIGVNFESWSLNVAPYLQAEPDQRLIDAKGQPSAKYMCTTHLLGEGWGAVHKCLQEKIDQIRPNTIDYDYEYGPLNGPHSCYCDRCLAAFRELARLPANVALSAEVISKQHRDLWVDFMARRVAKLFGMFRRSIHEISLQTRFSVYSGYATPDNAERYGVDWGYVGEEKGCDHAGCGYGRPVEATQATIEALQGIPLVCGLLLTPYDRDILTPVNALTKAWLLRTVLDSTGGVLVYERTEMDGRSWVAMGEATRLAAKYEDAFLRGRRVGLSGRDSAQIEVLQYERLTLVFLMNPSSQAMTLQVPLTGAWGSGEEFYSGRKLAAGATVESRLEPGEAEVVVLRR